MDYAEEGHGETGDRSRSDPEKGDPCQEFPRNDRRQGRQARLLILRGVPEQQQPEMRDLPEKEQQGKSEDPGIGKVPAASRPRNGRTTPADLMGPSPACWRSASRPSEPQPLESSRSHSKP